MDKGKPGTTSELQAAVDAVERLKGLGATCVEVPGVLRVELAPPKAAAGRELNASQRKRLAELEANQSRLEEIPGYRGGSA